MQSIAELLFIVLKNLIGLFLLSLKNEFPANKNDEHNKSHNDVGPECVNGIPAPIGKEVYSCTNHCRDNREQYDFFPVFSHYKNDY